MIQYNTIDGILIIKTVGDSKPERDSHTVIQDRPHGNDDMGVKMLIRSKIREIIIILSLYLCFFSKYDTRYQGRTKPIRT